MYSVIKVRQTCLWRSVVYSGSKKECPRWRNL